MRSVLPGSLFSEWMATVMSVSLAGEEKGEGSLASVEGGRLGYRGRKKDKIVVYRAQ